MESSEKITHAKVKFIEDDLKVIVPIEDIIEFEENPPVDARSFSRTTIYTCWYQDIKNPERTKYGVIIGSLGDATSLDKKRTIFASIDQSIIDEYKEKQMNESATDSLIDQNQEKNADKLSQKKQKEQRLKEQRTILRVKVNKLTSANIFTSPVTRSQKVDDTDFTESPMNRLSSKDDSIEEQKLDDFDLDDEKKNNENKDSDEDMNVIRNKLTNVQEKLELQTTKYQKLLLDHKKLMKENESLKNYNLNLQRIAFTTSTEAEGKMVTSTPKAEDKSDDQKKNKRMKSCTYMDDEFQPKHKFGDKIDDKSKEERTIYIRHGYSISRPKWKVLMSKKSDQKFCKEMFRTFYKDEEIVNRCIVEDDKKLTPNGMNKRRAVTPEKTDAIRRAMEFYIRENNKEMNVEMSEHEIAKKIDKARVQRILTEEINDKIKRAKKKLL